MSNASAWHLMMRFVKVGPEVLLAANYGSVKAE